MNRWQSTFIAEYLAQYGEEPLNPGEIRLIVQPMGKISHLIRVNLSEPAPYIRVPPEDQTIPLTSAEAKVIERLIIDNGFFDLPEDNNKFGFDGVTYSMEAHIGDRHHALIHWSPDEPGLETIFNEIITMVEERL